MKTNFQPVYVRPNNWTHSFLGLVNNRPTVDDGDFTGYRQLKTWKKRDR